MSTPKPALTFEEFEQLPDQPGKRELLKGVLIELPPAKLRHNNIAQRLFLGLHAALEAAHARGEAAGLGVARIGAGYKLGDLGYVQPDVSVTDAAQQMGEYLLGAPAIAIEVVTPGNSAREMHLKRQVYFEQGAREVWVVFPDDHEVAVYLPREWRCAGADELLTTPLLPNLALLVCEILGE